jgi:hypothetical protein
LFLPSCRKAGKPESRKAGKDGNTVCNPGLNFSVGRRRNMVLVNRAIQPKRETDLYFTCINRWRKIDEQLAVVASRGKVLAGRADERMM